MHPYRSVAPAPGPVRSPETPSDEAALRMVLILVGLVRVVVAVATSEDFGAEPTIGLSLIALATGGWWRGRPGR